VLTPVKNPAAYGLVETDASGRVLRFIEKPDPSQITTDTINAGIYVLETRVLDLMPAGQKHSIERSFFPDLLHRGDLVRAHVHRGYWIDIGTPEKYSEVHRDILARRFAVRLDGAAREGGWVDETARVAPGARLRGPFFIGPRCIVAEDATVGPDTVLVKDVTVGARASVVDTVVWEGGQIAAGARVESSLLGSRVRVGCEASLRGVVLGDESRLTDHSRTVC
jgi:NDP-sugar pyrophosphorylase family protein